MNTSFSKKRCIAEVNQRIEERYFSNKIKFVLNEQAATADNWPEKYNCVKGFSDGKRYNLEDGSASYLIRGVFYYSNGRAYSPEHKRTFSYECNGNDIRHTANGIQKGEEAAGAGAAGAGAAGAGAAGAGAAGARAPRYNSQNDPNFKLDGTTRTIQKDPYQYKLINCVWHFRRGPKRTKEWTSLANDQKSIDYLNSKFPDDIKNCPKPTSPVYQAQDNLDPDQMGTTNKSTTWSEYDKKMAQLKSDNPNKTEAELKKQINSDIYKSVKQQYFPGASGEEEKVY
jgi:hypothetical protein